MTTQHRKQVTHEKIQLGGLVVKAGLRDAEKALILGALIEVADAIENNDLAKIKDWHSKGDTAFTSE